MASTEDAAPVPHGAWPDTHEILNAGNRKDVVWYESELETVPPETRRLLEEYSGVAPDRVLAYLREFVSLNMPACVCVLSGAACARGWRDRRHKC